MQNEARPELWGRYAMVLNKQQGLLRDSCLEVVAPSSPGPPYPQQHAVSIHTPLLGTPEGGFAEHEAALQQTPYMMTHAHDDSMAPLQHQHQQQHPGSQALMPLPPSATHLESRWV